MSQTATTAEERSLHTELFSVNQLENHARALAVRHDIDARRGADRLLSRLTRNENSIDKAYVLLTDAVSSGRRITPAAEWFIDNHHFIAEQVRTSRRHLPRGYSRELPRLVNGPSAGMPRVYDMALELISHSHGHVDSESLRAFVTAYQEVCPLRLGELWAIPIMLRLALLENVRRVIDNVTEGRTDRERAGYWVERLLETAASEPAKVVLVVADMVKEAPRVTNPFAAEFAARLRGQGRGLVFASAWLEQRLAERGQSAERVFQLASQSQAADQVAVSNCIGSMRFLGATDWRDFVESISVVEVALRCDPAGVYAGMDFATRDTYRHVVEQIAKRAHRSEEEVAAEAVRLAADIAADGAAAERSAHVGFFLVDYGRTALEHVVQGRAGSPHRKRPTRRLRAVLYVGAIALLTGGATMLLASIAPIAPLPPWLQAALVVVLAVANLQLAIAIVDWAATLLVRPRLLPRLDFSRGIPAEQRTLVAVPSMLTDDSEIDGLLETLEVHRLANPDRQLIFALVTDFRDAAHEQVDGDQALLQRAREGVEALNARHTASGAAAPFYLFHRPRRWNPTEGVWMGWERKRGKLEELNAALRGDESGFSSIVGGLERLQSVKYVIALDSDTELPRDAARELVGTMAHPLNRPSVDARRGRINEGYAILQPRIAITMESASASRFAGLYSGEPGIDPYTRAVSDVYQDVFGEGSFVGKGIYDVDAFRQAIAGRLPENRVLSHDLLEGAYARAGLVSDVMLFEDYPAAYAVDVNRRNRWLRGDWQIAAWLGLRVPGGGGRRIRNATSWLSRLKILDNLRRSLLPIVLFALLIGGWMVPGMALFATAAVASILVVPGIVATGAALARRPAEQSRSRYAGEITLALGRQLLREGLAVTCLPYDASRNTMAILRTVWRVLVTRRRLLEWRTAADAARGARTHLAEAYVSMWIAPATATAVAAGLLVGQPDALWFAAPLLVLWALAPALTWWLSLPQLREPHRLEVADLRFLRVVARRTWRFFETFVGAGDNHLPPDNFQEEPSVGAAHRTSPTNIGLALVANLAAYDFGYISAGRLIERSTLCLESVGKLQRFRGHLYNWYDTRSLEPLPPVYVSTVDSGNLAGHLLTLAAGFRELATHPVVSAQLAAGLIATLDADDGLAEAAPELAAELAAFECELSATPPSVSGAYQLLQRLISGRQDSLHTMQATGSAEIAWWAGAFESQCRQALEEIEHLAPWVRVLANLPGGARELSQELQRLDHGPTLAETAALEQTVVPAIDTALAAAGDAADDGSGTPSRWLADLRDAVLVAAARAAARLSELYLLAEQCTTLADLDYGFLYDRERRLLSIGYHVGDHRLDASYYDLLASEARLGSFVAIAQDKLPQEHWFSLGRLIASSRGKPVLASWSGSMFEYLMPLLVMPTYQRTVLDESYRGVVQRQIAYGRERRVPWGVSESCYNETDAQLAYQYRAFGVPGLGLKRGLGDDLVIAPYASAMALMVTPAAACQNLHRLAADGLLGECGFYEAVDYTPVRLPPGKDRVIVRSYMAHHQGMVLLSLVHLLRDRPMQRRFDSDPAFRATQLLLQERMPRTLSIHARREDTFAAAATGVVEQNVRVFDTASTPAPAVQLLSNGTYHVAVTNSGAGYSRWGNLAVTRWREDPTCDSWGSFCYLRDLTEASGEPWSVAHHPTGTRADHYQAVFSLGRAEFRRRDHSIDTHVEISVSPEDDVELRRVSLTNLGRTPRTIELTSFAEVVLAPLGADVAHPAFSNLFVQTEIVRARQAILCTRRPRSADEKQPWMLHLMAVDGHQVGATSFETRREQFLGRGRQVADPAAMHRASLLDSEGAVLDPAVAIRNAVLIEPDETVAIHLVTGIAETRDGALALVEKYRDRHSADRVFDLSWTRDQVLLRRLEATEADVQLYERLVSNLLYSSSAMRASSGVLTSNRSDQSALWAHSISGDLPIALVRIARREHLALVRQMVQAHAYWRLKGVAADLVIWNEDPSGYRQVLQDEIAAVIGTLADASVLDKPGGIFLRRSDQLSEEDEVLMQAVARLIVDDAHGTLAEQMNRPQVVSATMPPFTPRRRAVGPEREAEASDPVASSRRSLTAWNGHGGFSQDGREYVILTQPDAPTPAPWVNVLANPHFGSVISERGSAYTWCENAHSYRLTPWHNDPVSDTGGEAFYIRDEQSGNYWSPAPFPAGGEQPYTTRHGFGYSVFEHSDHGITSALTTFVAVDAPVKFMILELENRSGRSRRLSVTAFYELVLGEHRPANMPHVVSEMDPSSGALFARNHYSSDFAPRVAFLESGEGQRWCSADRLEIIGRNGSMAQPACMGQEHLSGRVGARLDPCLAMQVVVDLADGEKREVAFIFGSGRDSDEAQTLVDTHRGARAAHASLEAVTSHWQRTLGAVQVSTPDVSLNLLANGWLLYQVLSSRMWGRSGFYQSGGAYGFRDQLQDAMALVHTMPELLREQILRSAARQFREGDVQHWWHPPRGRGVRTRISDDYLFLPLAVCRYVAAIGDTGLLDEQVQFLDGRRVNSDEDSYYDLPLVADESGTVYEHCVRAIENGLRLGEHGLPLMGSGDWNDSMNLVGDQGKGESVWLAFFLYDVLTRFGELARAYGDGTFADRCAAAAKLLGANIEQHAWDGQWYRRAYMDSGQPLGSASSTECQIDSLPQSWAVLSRAGDPERWRQALASLDRRLVRPDLGLIQLFDPPFDSSSLEPGYVKGYVPGVRENGGQYTHAAIWAVMAFAAAGDVERAWELFVLINPVRHGSDAPSIATYKVEPYVVAADVYTNPQHAGRGGWTWYTGSAAWMYRLVVESLLGLRLEVDRLYVEPLMPAAWEAFDVDYRYRGTLYHVHVSNLGGGGRNVRRLVCDGVEQAERTILLHDDGIEHHVVVEIGDSGNPQR